MLSGGILLACPQPNPEAGFQPQNREFLRMRHRQTIQDCVKNTGKMGMWGVHTLFTSILPSISDLA
jgi:hypothetical protein